MPPNPFLLAADNSPDLLPLLRSNPSLASRQDEHGYSLLHAAASYNHLDLLRTVVHEFGVPVDLRDEDAETALFVVETVEAARCLVEELKLDANIRGAEGLTAREKVESEGDYPRVAAYLKELEQRQVNGEHDATDGINGSLEASLPALPPAPEGLSVTVGTMRGDEDDAPEPDPAFRRRIEQLATREDFHTPAGQAELRMLVEEALAGQGLTQDRSTRPRQE